MVEKRLIDESPLLTCYETPEGRSVVILAKKFGIRARQLSEISNVNFVPFTVQTRMSGVGIDGQSYRKGAADAIRSYLGCWKGDGKSFVPALQ
jgi:high-affinity K+ transport system ATPase subunit B